MASKCNPPWVSVKTPPEETGWYMVYAGGAYGAMGWDAEAQEWEDWTYAKAHNIIIPWITFWAPWPEVM